MAKISISRVRQLIDKNIEKKNWQIKPFGEGKFSETFLATDGSREYVIRVAPPDSLLQLFYEYHMMRQEPRIHQLVLKHTNVPVPSIIRYDFSRHLIERDYVIMPRLEGITLNQANLTATERKKVFKQLGNYLRQIHAITDSENFFGYLGEHHCMEPRLTWWEAFKTMFSKELDDFVKTGIYNRKTADGIYQVLEAQARVFEYAATSHLLHGDLRMGNILVNDNREISGVLDFDRACWGDVEWDLAIVEYCGLLNEDFWQGYGKKINIQEGDAAIRRMFYLLYEHQKYIVISMSDRRNDPARARKYADDSLAVIHHFKETGKPAFF